MYFILLFMSDPNLFTMNKQTEPSAREADYYINRLGLQPHPEGGWYKETYRAEEMITQNGLPLRFEGNRNISTTIYYLLQRNEYSAFHKIKSDEGWHWYAGGSLIIHQIEESGSYSCVKLGNDLDNSERFQWVVPANVWFAVELLSGLFVLAGCTVSPGFNFSDFEMANPEVLSTAFPQYTHLIKRLCR